MDDTLKYRPFPSMGNGVVWLLATETEMESFRRLSSFNCSHPKTELRDYQTSNGGWQRKEQCLACGRAASNSKKRIPGDGTPAWNPDLELIYDAEMIEAREAMLDFLLARTEAKLEPGYATYDAYLRSEEWKGRRDRVLKRDNNLCQACLSAAATEVHHLTYERIFKEPLFDLVAVCRHCHETLHDKNAASHAAAEAEPASARKEE